MLNGRERIVFCIPTMNDQMHAGITDFLVAIWQLQGTDEFPWTFDYIRVDNVRYIEAARNKLVRLFLEKPEADRLFFIDSDTIPSVDTFRLLRIDAPIVAGWYPVRTGEKSNLPPITTSGYVKHPTKTGWIPLFIDQVTGKAMEVDGVATGNMVIHRSVLEDPRMCTGTDDDGTKAIFTWPRKPSGASLRSDDLDFCLRAQVAGYKIVCHTGVVWGHVKPTDQRWVLDTMLDSYKVGRRDAEKNEERTIAPETQQLIMVPGVH